MDNTIYIVSGFMRTGSSMMMKALVSGGMDSKYSKSRDDMKMKHADESYDPNEGGLYELSPSDYKEKNFPEGYEGKLIKVLGPGISRIKPVEDIKLIYMRRDAEEIRQSYDAFFDQNIASTEEIQRRTDRFLLDARNRKDISSINVFWYREVLKDPRPCFEELVNSGWDIDVEKCIQIVNPELCRFKKENLTIGI